MSDYRDDVNEIGVAGDETWLRLRSIAESTAHGGDQLFCRIRLLTTETGNVADVEFGSLLTLTTETVIGVDEYLQSVNARNTVIERARSRDSLFGRQRASLIENAIGNDELFAAAFSVLVEQGHGRDEVFVQRRGSVQVTEHAKASDALLMVRRTLVDEAASASDSIQGKLRVHAVMQDWAQVADAVLDMTKARPHLITERAIGVDAVSGRLLAHDLISDLPAVGWDELPGIGELTGQAWTADAGAWAMSRYAPFGFCGLAVIDSELYAIAPDGVYALDGDSERITGELRTGLMDMTGDVLALPVESHVEYELSEGGMAWVDVTQTQAGKAQTYAYPIKGRPLADTLTNARFEFGRGLRGRHFAYTLRLEAERAHINDWSVLAMPSKRSL